MKIVVVGGGRLAFFLIQALMQGHHEIILIEEQMEVSEHFASRLEGVEVFHGDGTDINTLEEAGCFQADYYVAVTGKDENNLVGCQIAKKRFAVRNTVARINNPRNKQMFQLMGVDLYYSSTEILVDIIEQDIAYEGMRVVFNISDSPFNIVEIEVSDHVKAIGKTLAEYDFPGDSRVVMITRGTGESITPSGDTRIEQGDRLLMICDQQVYKALYDTLVR